MKTKIASANAAMLAFVKDDEGTSMIEYGLMAALVSLACVPALTAAGKSIDDLMTKVSAALDALLPTSAAAPPLEG